MLTAPALTFTHSFCGGVAVIEQPATTTGAKRYMFLVPAFHLEVEQAGVSPDLVYSIGVVEVAFLERLYCVLKRPAVTDVVGCVLR